MSGAEQVRGWLTRRLSDCGKLVTGGTPNRSNPEYWNGSIPWISAKSLKQFELYDSEDKVTDAGASNGTTTVPKGTVLFVVRGMSLAKEFRVGVTAKPVTFNQDVRGLIPKTDVEPRYLARFLRASESRVMTLVDNASHGTKRLTADRLAELKVPLPPLPEQRRIAEMLDGAEALRAKRRAALAKLDTLIQAIFLEMFGDPATNAKGWPVERLSSVSKFENGDRSGNYPSGNDIKSEGVLFLSTRNIVDSQLDLSITTFISKGKFDSLTRGKAKLGDLIITLRGTLGSCCIFDADVPTAFINAQMMIIRPNGTVTPEFLHALLVSSSVKAHLLRIGNGAAVPQLTATQLADVPVPHPPLVLQQEFARRVAAVEKLKTTQRTSLAKLDALFASLQHRAFRGEL